MNGAPLKHAIVVFTVAVLVSGAPGAALLACNDTAGERVSFDTLAVSESTTFENALGWKITLGEALLATGPLYYFAEESALARRSRASALMKQAFAHPGHFAAGNARGEMTTPWTIDLLARNVLPRGHGLTGALRSARLSFAHQQHLLGEHVVRIAGVASRAGTSVTFHANARLEDVADREGHPEVDQCVFRAAEVTGDGTVTLTIRPAEWLDQIDFDGVSGDLADAPVAFNAFSRGLKKRSAYAFAYEAR